MSTVDPGLFLDVMQQMCLVPVGTTLRLRCPACERLGCFAATRTDHNLMSYMCHEATCGYKGHGSIDSELPNYGQIIGKKPTGGGRYEGPLLPLSPLMAAKLSERFHIAEDMLRHYVKDAGMGWFALPVFNSDGEEVGHVLRWDWTRTRDTIGIKSKLYVEPGTVPMCWYEAMAEGRPLVLVEDQISAIRLYESNSYYNIAALLGAELTYGRVAAIQAAGMQRIVLALDADATEYAFNQAKRWQAAFDHIRVMVLEEDVKDMSEKKFTKFARSI